MLANTCYKVFTGLLRPQFHFKIRSILFTTQHFTTVKSLVEDIIYSIGFSINDYSTIHRHLELYFTYAITYNKRVPFVLYCCNFPIEKALNMSQYLVHHETPDEESAINMIYNDPVFQSKRTLTHLCSSWINRLHMQGYLKMRDCFDELKNHRRNSKSAKECNDSSQRYTREAVLKLLRPKKNDDPLELHQISDHGRPEDYIVLSYNSKQQVTVTLLQILINNKNIPTQSLSTEQINPAIHSFIDYADSKSHNQDDIYTSGCDIYDEDIQELKDLFFQALGNRKLIPRTFFFIYIRNAFKQLICNDNRGHRWSPSVLCFAHDLLTLMGYNAYEALARGLRHGQKFEPSTERCNLVLPCSTTLDNHFHTTLLGEGDTQLDKDDFNKLVGNMKLNRTQSLGILQIDAMDVTPHLGIHTKLGLLYGASEGPLKISDCPKFAERSDFPDDKFLAQKIVQTLFCNIDGSVRIPTNFKVCKTETETIISEVISTFHSTYTENIVCTVSDAGSANFKHFTSNTNNLHHFCYSHLCKNIRNAINGRPKLYPVATKVGTPNTQIAPQSSTYIYSTESGRCHLMKITIRRSRSAHIT